MTSPASKLVLASLCATLLSSCFWTNKSGSQTAELEALGSPANIGEIVAAIKRTEQDNQQVKMTGSAASFSDVAITGDGKYLMEPKKLNKPLTLRTEQLKGDVDSSKLVRVMSGMKISQLNQYLEGRGLGFPNVGGWDGQTLAGVMMTATHGSGLDYGPMETFIKSMQVVVNGGQVLQIEPTNGITDPEKFNATVNEDSSIPMTLIQDDDTFNAMKVSLGSMGVVYSLTMEATDFFWIRERREVTTWAALTAPGGFIDTVTSGNYKDLRHPDHPEWGTPDFFEFQINPYEVDGKHNVLLTHRWKVDPNAPENQGIKAPLTRGQFGNETSSFLTTQIESILAAIVEGHPEIVPGFTNNILKLQSEGDRVYQNKSYKVFNIGVVNDTDVYGIELSGDIANTKAYIESTMALLEGYLNADKPRIVTVPVAVRFSKHTDTLIAMQNLRNSNNQPVDSVHLEFINLKDITYSKQIMIDIQDHLMQEGLRPHWGLTLVDTPAVQGEQHLIDRYGQNWTKWKTIMNRYNPDGTFDGRFTDRLGISK